MDKTTEMTSITNTLPPALLEVASTLIENLTQSEPFLSLQAAEQELQADQEAMQLLTEFSTLQQQIRNQKLFSSNSPREVKRLQELQSAIQANTMINNHAKAQQRAITFLQEINAEISNVLGFDFASITRRSGGCC